MAARHRRRSKWIVVLAAPLFFAVQAALGLQVEWAKPEQLDAAFGARLQWLRWQRARHADKPLVLMLGGSRTMTGFRPDVLQDEPYLAFNFGREGSGPVKNLIHLRRLLDEGIRPDFLLVDITAPALADDRETPWEDRYLDGALLNRSERQLVEQYHDRGWRILRQWLAARLMPSWRSNRPVAACLSLQRLTGYNCFDDAPGMDPWGYRPVCLEVSPQQRERFTDLAMRQYAFLASQERLAAGAQRAVVDLVDLCRQEKIPLTLVVMPEGAQFRGLYRQSFQHACDLFLADLARDKQTHVIDARTWIADDGFYDQHHALPGGAEHFTRRLAAVLRQRLPS